MPQTAPYTPAQFNDRRDIREHCLCLGWKLLNAIGNLDQLPITTETNETFAAVRDMLSDLLTEIEGRSNPVLRRD